MHTMWSMWRRKCSWCVTKSRVLVARTCCRQCLNRWWPTCASTALRGSSLCQSQAMVSTLIHADEEHAVSSHQQDNIAVKVHGSCNVHSLLLPTTQVNATLTNLCH